MNRYRSVFVMCALIAVASMASAKTTGLWNVTSEWNSASWTNGLPEEGDTVIIGGSSLIVLTNSTPPLAQFIITNTATLVFDGWDTTLLATDVLVFATVTHTNNPVSYTHLTLPTIYSV